MTLSRRGFLRLAGITASSIFVPGALWVPPERSVVIFDYVATHELWMHEAYRIAAAYDLERIA